MGRRDGCEVKLRGAYYLTFFTYVFIWSGKLNFCEEKHMMMMSVAFMCRYNIAVVGNTNALP